MKIKQDVHNIWCRELEGFLKRLPVSQVCKMQIRRFLEQMVSWHGNMMFDFASMLSMDALIRLGWCGTGKNATRIYRYEKAVQELMEHYTEVGDEFAPQACYNSLYDKGIPYVFTPNPWMHENHYRDED